MLLMTTCGVILMLLIARTYLRRYVSVDQSARRATRALVFRARKVRAANDNVRQCFVYKVEHGRPRRW
jgi:hypothetical protein